MSVKDDVYAIISNFSTGGCMPKIHPKSKLSYSIIRLSKETIDRDLYIYSNDIPIFRVVLTPDIIYAVKSQVDRSKVVPKHINEVFRALSRLGIQVKDWE